MKTIQNLAVALLFTLALSACGTSVKTEQASLYERLGGKDAITAVVNHLWGVVSTDDRINHYFANTKPDVFAGLMIDFLCQGSGGPCTYTGKDMYQAHIGMNITSEHFDALAEDIVTTLNHFKVPTQEKNEVMAMLGSMKEAVINH